METMKLTDKPVLNTTASTARERIDRAKFLLDGISVLANAITCPNILDPYDVEEVAIIIDAIAWEANAELAPFAASDIYVDQHA